MATTTILHVGEDICRRIPVMELTGLTVVSAEPSIFSIRSAIAKVSVSAIAFQCDRYAPQKEVVRATREISVPARLILFQNPCFSIDETAFDLVIPALTSPTVWLKQIGDVIEASRRLCEQTRQLRQDSLEVRARSRALREASGRVRVSPIDPDVLWRPRAPEPEKRPKREERE